MANKEKGYIGDDMIGELFGQADELTRKDLMSITKSIKTLVELTKGFKDTELAYILIADYYTRLMHNLSTIVRRELEALTTAKFIKKALDKGEDKETVYDVVAGNMATVLSNDEFGVVIQEVDRILADFYGIDDFLEKLFNIANEHIRQMDRDVM